MTNATLTLVASALNHPDARTLADQLVRSCVTAILGLLCWQR